MRQAARETISPTDPAYPRRLRGALGDRHVLHVLGTIGEPELAVAIVGARAASLAARSAAFSLARSLAERGATVISGGAIGIDAAAHEGALAGGGATIAVLGCGVDVVYPTRNARLFDRIAHGGGALVSTFPDGTLPLRGLFVARNRVIAALVDAVVIIEASATSGSLHTARAAIELGRGLGAVAGSPGARQLHAAGAAVVATADDVVALATGRATRRAAVRAVDATATRVAHAIGSGATVDALADATGLSARLIACALVDLEIAGWVRARPDGSYVLTAIAPIAGASSQ